MSDDVRCNLLDGWAKAVRQSRCK